MSEGRRATRSRRARVVLGIALGLLAVAIVAAVVAVRLVPSGTRTYSFAAAGVPQLSVTQPAGDPAPMFEVQAAPATSDLLRGVRALSRVVHIADTGLSGTATLRMRYDPGTLPAGSDPASDLGVFTRTNALGLWLPDTASVDTAHHTVTVVTSHFSDWLLGVTDPAELADEQATERMLSRTAGGKLASLLDGDPDTLSCSASRLLVTAAVKSDLVLGAKLCEQVVDDGSYELKWVNDTGLPVKFVVPKPFRATGSDDTDVRIQKVLAYFQPDGVYVLPGKTLTVDFPGDAVQPSTELLGQVDWSLWLVSMMEDITEAALGDEQGTSEDLKRALDAVFDTKKIADCALEHLAELKSAKTLVKGLTGVVRSCEGTIAGIVWEVAKSLAKAAGHSIAAFISKRIEGVLAIPDLLKLADSEVAGLTAAVGVSFHELDDTVALRPGRFMTATEAFAYLPTPTSDGSGLATCSSIDAATFLPPGTPAGPLCAQVTSLDLDGDGKPDRLITWGPPLASGASASPADPTRIGAVAYLSGGGFHLLENPATSWTLRFGGGSALTIDPTVVYSHEVVHAADDRSESLLLTVTEGSSTAWSVLLALGTDDRLRAVGQTGGDRAGSPVAIPDGGAVSYSSGYDCVRSGSRPLFAEWSIGSDTGGGQPPFSWREDFFTFDRTSLTAVGSRTGSVSAQSAAPLTSGHCASADPATRGPDVGAIGQ